MEQHLFAVERAPISIEHEHSKITHNLCTICAQGWWRWWWYAVSMIEKEIEKCKDDLTVRFWQGHEHIFPFRLFILKMSIYF